MIALPALFALITPLEDTLTILLSEEKYSTLSLLVIGESVTASFNVCLRFRLAREETLFLVDAFVTCRDLVATFAF